MDTREVEARHVEARHVETLHVQTREPTGSPKRVARSSYSSAVRSGQASSTRQSIVVAAADLFVEQGYAATTIDAIAKRAGVGRKTVFSSVGGKGALLKLAWDWAITGDDEPIPMSERPAVQAILAERDAQRMVWMWVDLQLDVVSRATALGTVVLAAADRDETAGALRDLIRSETLAGATAFVTHLAGAGGLRAEISIERGADACWALVNSLLPHLLVANRGWSLQQYGEWLAQVAATTLLEPGGTASSRPTLAVRTVDDPARERYEAYVDGRVVGHLSYEGTERLMVLTHTEVDPGFDEVGVADALVRFAFDDVRARGSRRVVPLCHYVAWWIGRNPDDASLVYDPKAN